MANMCYIFISMEMNHLTQIISQSTPPIQYLFEIIADI